MSVLGSGTILVSLWAPGLPVPERTVFVVLLVVSTIGVAAGFARWSGPWVRYPAVRTGLYVFGIAGGTLALTAVSALLMSRAGVPPVIRCATIVSALVIFAWAEIPVAVIGAALVVALVAVAGAGLSITDTVLGGPGPHRILLAIYSCLPISLTVVGWERLAAEPVPRQRILLGVGATLVVTLVVILGGGMSAAAQWPHAMRTSAAVLVSVVLASYAGRNLHTLAGLLGTSGHRRAKMATAAVGYTVLALLLVAAAPRAVLLPLVCPALATACLYLPVAIGRPERIDAQ
ncbi:hypothetical protein [Nocardia sp. BMG111209]|uniref:hypothetical protein n=1 Tax=Nocardia sp. BMG111209 TaxID=1160137 RepID=UPI0003A210DA|nr:hypothetical protein [Nocardia sp. BMG111209]